MTPATQQRVITNIRQLKASGHMAGNFNMSEMSDEFEDFCFQAARDFDRKYGESEFFQGINARVFCSAT